VTGLALQAGDPQRVGPYLLLGRLGSGGMGRVYLARSPGGRQVAVKVIRDELAEDTAFRARFAREVAAARKVGGLFTAPVVDASLDSPVPWLVTEYVPGVSLTEAVEQAGPLPDHTVLAMAAGLAEGLSAIHAAGVIHRDLKPGNVLMAPDGPRIIDFGISSAAEAASLTDTGVFIGSPGFMSPEQAEAMPVGPLSDIFSLAGVLTYAARGEGPFGGGDTAALLYRVVHGTPNLDRIPARIQPLIARCLSREAQARPTAAEFLVELSAAYPAAADLTDWLPAAVLRLSAQRTAEPGPASVATGSLPAAGYGGSAAQQALPPLPYANQAYAGQPYAGQPYAGQPYAGQPYAGEPYAGQPYAGEPYAGQPHAGQPHAGQPYAGQPERAGERRPGQQRAGEPRAAEPRAGEHRRERRPGGRRRPRWLWAAGAVMVCAAVVVALVVSLGSRNSPAAAGAGSSPAGSTAGPGPQGSPRTGDLAVAEFRVGDCLTGANMQLDTTNPWPKLTTAVSCSRPHTAEVFFADNSFWPANSAFPGASAISKAGNTACDNAFRSYVGVPLAKSVYTWTNIIPDAATWPTGDRALHCIAYYATPGQPAGVKLTGSIKESRK
jgi:Protein kinase domain/Septum formation